MGGFFICYRRSDSAYVTGRLYDRLVQKFGPQRVFKDVYSIRPGRDFDHEIRAFLAKTRAVLVVMGAQWNPARLHEKDDPVRHEIEQALALGIEIIPLFIDGVKMPPADQVPESIHRFVKRNGLPLRQDPDFDQDVQRLLTTLGPHTGNRTWAAIGGVGLALSVAVGAAAYFAARPQVFTDTMKKNVRQRLAGRVCSIDEEGKVLDCGFPTKQACQAATARTASVCEERPLQVYCRPPKDATPESIRATSCYLQAPPGDATFELLALAPWPGLSPPDASAAPPVVTQQSPEAGVGPDATPGHRDAAVVRPWTGPRAKVVEEATQLLDASACEYEVKPTRTENEWEVSCSCADWKESFISGGAQGSAELLEAAKKRVKQRGLTCE